MHLPGFLNAPGMSLSAEIRDFLRNFRVALIYFSHFVFAPRRLQSTTTQQLISSLWTEKLNRY